MAETGSYAGLSTMLVVQGANVALLAKVLQQQRRDGMACVQLLEGAAPAPSQGAPEPGKGQLVDVCA
jgi:hypothetical protein